MDPGHGTSYLSIIAYSVQSTFFSRLTSEGNTKEKGRKKKWEQPVWRCKMSENTTEEDRKPSRRTSQAISYIHPHANPIEMIVIRTTYEPLRYGPLSVFPAELVELAAE